MSWLFTLVTDVTVSACVRCTATAFGCVETPAHLRGAFSGTIPDSESCSRSTLDSVWQKVGGVKVGKLFSVGEQDCLTPSDYSSDCFVESNEFVVSVELLGRNFGPHVVPPFP
jgi:hypothetical protein